MNGGKSDIDPQSELREEDDDASLPELDLDDAPSGTLAAGRKAIAHFARLAPSSPGVYRMLDAKGDALYVGKARSLKNRVANYTHLGNLSNRLPAWSRKRDPWKSS